MAENVREPSIYRPVPELPPDDLIFRIAGTSHHEWFWKTGQVSIDQFNAALAHVGRSFTDFSRALDFGCGCGRVQLHLEDAAKGMELYGVDIDGEAIAWAQQHIPWATFSVNQGLPPLDFPDEYFDLVYNHSVFTHLDEHYQDAWLVELERITKPGGMLALSVAGDYCFDKFEKHLIEWKQDPVPFRDRLRDTGILFMANDGAVDSPFPDFYRTTFHQPWYTFERWGGIFDIKAYIVRGDLDLQDIVLLRRREERVGVVPRPHAGAKRDAQLSACQEDKKRVERQLSEVLHSRSWRVTAPMRNLATRLRGK